MNIYEIDLEVLFSRTPFLLQVISHIYFQSVLFHSKSYRKMKNSHTSSPITFKSCKSMATHLSLRNWKSWSQRPSLRRTFSFNWSQRTRKNQSLISQIRSMCRLLRTLVKWKLLTKTINLYQKWVFWWSFLLFVFIGLCEDLYQRKRRQCIIP